jgi:hypothetical protein
MVSIYTTCSNILKLCILPIECICVFRIGLKINNNFPPKNVNRFMVFVTETSFVSCEVRTKSLLERNPVLIWLDTSDNKCHHRMVSRWRTQVYISARRQDKLTEDFPVFRSLSKQIAI